MWANWNKSSTCFPAGRKKVRLFSSPGKLGMNPGFWRSRSAIFWRQCLSEHEHQGCITKPHVCHRCSVVWILNIKWNKAKGWSSTWIWEMGMGDIWSLCLISISAMSMSTMHWHHVLVPHVELLSFERCRGICARVCRWQEEHRLSASGQGGAVPVHTPQHHKGPRAGITTSKQGSQTSL